MKANRKFLTNDDEAVSPVIAVILMVAITVVLAATVYVWVSGFGGNGSQPAKSLALTSNGALNGEKEYVIASASPGLRWSDMTFTVNGAPQAFDPTPTAGECVLLADLAANEYEACTGGRGVQAAGDVVDAGDLVRFTATAGQTLRILDTASNSIILTMTIS